MDAHPADQSVKIWNRKRRQARQVAGKLPASQAAGWPRRSGKQVKFIKRYMEMKKMIETIGKALYDMVAWVGCLTTGESWEEVKNEE